MAMSEPDPSDDTQREALRDEARRLASSGKYATWHEVADALVDDRRTPDQIRAVFAQDRAFQDEIEALAESAHGVGGPATE